MLAASGRIAANVAKVGTMFQWKRAFGDTDHAAVALIPKHEIGSRRHSHSHFMPAVLVSACYKRCIGQAGVRAVGHVDDRKIGGWGRKVEVRVAIRGGRNI